MSSIMLFDQSVNNLSVFESFNSCKFWLTWHSTNGSSCFVCGKLELELACLGRSSDECCFKQPVTLTRWNIFVWSWTNNYLKKCTQTKVLYFFHYRKSVRFLLYYLFFALLIITAKQHSLHTSFIIYQLLKYKIYFTNFLSFFPISNII